MITFFPTPYEDELAYSIVSRYHKWSYNITGSLTTQELFEKNLIVKVDFFQNIHSLTEKLSHFSYITEDVFLKKFTMYNYYSAFLDFISKERLKDYMIHNKNNLHINHMLEINEYKALNHNYLKFCPQCYEEEHVNNVPYWHLSHNLPGVLVCLKHHQILLDSLVPFNGKKIVAADIYTVKENNKEGLVFYKELLLEVAKESKKLIDNEVDYSNIITNYYTILHKNGYVRNSGEINTEKLFSHFISHYDSKFLSILKLSFDSIKYHMTKIGYFNTQIPPLFHILLIIFLNKTFGDTLFIDKKTPFGNIPFKCLNIYCNQYSNKALNNYKIEIQNSKVLGVFTCKCGFSYKKDYNKSLENSNYEVISVGESWRENFYHLVYVKDFPLKYICKYLNVTMRTVYNELFRAFPFEKVSKSDIEKYRYHIKHNKKLFKCDSYTKALAWVLRNDLKWAHEQGLC
ncbi:TnsD family Tn7-like transposition protein [Oceanobacillus sp. ISL-73]|uniref:TnsD family Tn7-like transposition protein n=1 Tax=Oceanobacillus sp. ISL-73 TaxID=2819161 RepID=UPI001BEB8D9C|nr:TnsD family Tn7-like transposition protein [Oceanobacillus sp. ISL-73]MBT2653238.1 TniQ family protein [Oceanobacillus sp. ISL-73]